MCVVSPFLFFFAYFYPHFIYDVYRIHVLPRRPTVRPGTCYRPSVCWCLSVTCMHPTHNSERICMKFSRRLRHRPRKNRLNFGGDRPSGRCSKAENFEFRPSMIMQDYANKFPTDLHKIFKETSPWAKEEEIKSWWRSTHLKVY